jgi:Ca2+/Na+ antiporter
MEIRSYYWLIFVIVLGISAGTIGYIITKKRRKNYLQKGAILSGASCFIAIFTCFVYVNPVYEWITVLLCSVGSFLFGYFLYLWYMSIFQGARKS